MPCCRSRSWPPCSASRCGATARAWRWSTGVLGVVALLIALLRDLPDAHATGLVGSAATGLRSASSSPGVGLYLETLGAVVLLITAVCGLLLLAPPDLFSRSRAGGSGRVPAAARRNRRGA